MLNLKGKKTTSGGGEGTPRSEGGPSPVSYVNEKPFEAEGHDDIERRDMDNSKVRIFRGYTLAVAAIVSIGGFIFGYGEFGYADIRNSA